MVSQTTRTGTLSQKIRHELIEYGFNILYLTLVFGAFTEYRRLLFAAHDITYTDYFVSLIEAVVLGKVIMIGSLVRLGRGLEARPLIFPTLYKTFVFMLFCAAFKILEFGIKGLVKGEGFVEGTREFAHRASNELPANAIVVFVAFVPFFAAKELGRVLGDRTLVDLFFRRSSARA